jgi:hypothetical protein|nr:MAG TPA_asm: hypothetical protein [Caudoviricetes sp.]
MWINPIYDRTQSDVNEIKNNPLSSNTKGAFNCSDLNRIENNTIYVANLFAQVYGFSLNLQTKTNWSIEDIPTIKEINRIRNNVLKISREIFIENFQNIEFSKTINYVKANALEYNLLLIKNTLENYRDNGIPIVGNVGLDSSLDIPL